MKYILIKEKMIITKKIKIGLSPKNVDFYEDKGYKIPRKIDNRGRINFTKGTKIEVETKDLMSTSKIKVEVECEHCQKKRWIHYDSLLYRKNSQYLITGRTLCVKCSNKSLFTGENSPNYKHGNNRYCEYRYSANKRNICFNLTVKEFEDLIIQKCYYCDGYSTDTDKNSRGNGIDRKDSNKPYDVLNGVPCCATCNFVKNNMPYIDFIKYIRRLYEKTKNYEI